jgi:hypothetical protein
MRYKIIGIKNNGHVGTEYEVDCVRPESTAEYKRLKKKVNQGKLMKVQVVAPKAIDRDSFVDFCVSRSINPGIALENQSVLIALKNRDREALVEALENQF